MFSATQQNQFPQHENDGSDLIEKRIRNIAEYILVGVFGLLPIFFIPSQAASLEYSKILFVIGGVFLALIFYSLSVLRSGKIVYGTSLSFIALWVVALVAVLSALMSGDRQDAFVGDLLGIHTAVFVALLALIATVWLVVGVNKKAIMRLFALLFASTIILALFHLLRLFVGEGTLSLGVFSAQTATPVGSWNDLALFFGLAILLALVTLEQIPLTKAGKLLLGFVVVVSLIMLGVINFFMVWLVLGLVSLVILVFTIGRDRLFGISKGTASPAVHQEGEEMFTPQSQRQKVLPISMQSTVSLVFPTIVFIVSLVFLIGGNTISQAVSETTGISYIEVRPSLQATTDIAKNVYGENAFLGIGTNKFSDAWRLYKNEAINSTIFWDTTFEAGNGYITTFFVTTGVLGIIAWVVFLALFLFSGARMVFSEAKDEVWYFIGTASFVGGIYVWGMSLVYVPGATLLLIGALCTGLTFASVSALTGRGAGTFFVGANRRAGFALTLVVMVVIIGSVSALYGTGKHFSATYVFADSVLSVVPGTNLETIEQQIASAYDLVPNDAFARRIAEYQFSRMSALLALENVTEDQQQQFQTAVVNGVNAGRLAIEGDRTDPRNWAAIGHIYAVLVGANVEQSYELAKEALEKAREFDPKNPLRVLELAQLEIQAQNLTQARQLTEQAVSMKPDYGDALYTLSQIAITEGDTETAVLSTRAIISIDPRNPARYYQLGVLEAARRDVQRATSAFEEAVRLDPNYANARYFLALAYNEAGRAADARAQLERVLELNPGNQLVTDLIAQLDANGSIATNASQAAETEVQPVVEQNVVSQNLDDVTTTEVPDTSLITPVNVGGESGEPESSESEPPQTVTE